MQSRMLLCSTYSKQSYLVRIFQEQSYMRIIQTQGDGTVAPHWSQGCCSITLSLGFFGIHCTFLPGHTTHVMVVIVTS